jgi:fructokinase
LRIGIDLGGTKIEAIALADTATGAGATLLRHRVPTPVGDYAGHLNAVAELVELTERETGQAGTVGIATPGAISPSTGLFKNSNSTVLNGKPLDRDLEARLGRPQTGRDRPWRERPSAVVYGVESALLTCARRPNIARALVDS